MIVTSTIISLFLVLIITVIGVSVTTTVFLKSRYFNNV